MIKLRPEVVAALHNWWFNKFGTHLPNNEGVELHDPVIIERLFQFSIPGEDVNDTVLRIIRGGASTSIH